MLGLPAFSFPLQQSNLQGTPSATLPGTTVTASGSTHTKGSWSSLIDPLNFDTQLLMIKLGNVQTSATDTKVLVDIGVGPTGGGSEQVVIPDMQAGGALTIIGGGPTLVVPFRLKRGTRLSARCQALIASDTVQVLVFAFGGMDYLPFPVFTKAVAYGIDSANSRGTSHTPGNSGSESTWTNFGSTTSHNHKAWFVMCGGPSGTTWTGIGYHIEIGKNSTTWGEWHMATSTSEDISGPLPPFPVFREAAAGTQMQIRAEASGTAQALYPSIYGFS